MTKNQNPIEHEMEEGQGQDRAVIDAVDTKFALARKIIFNIREELESLEALLNRETEQVDPERIIVHSSVRADIEAMMPGYERRVVEGVFDGLQMVGSDGRQYPVPQNYASKSKLVEGDILKLTIQPNGGFMFKQIGPIERERLVGMLIQDENTREWKVVADSKKYAVLTASVSYYKGQPGDTTVILVPKSAPSKWAAVENIIRQE